MSTATMMDSPLSADLPAPGLLGLAEKGWLPDALVRHGIRRLCRQRLRQERIGGASDTATRYQDLIQELNRSPLAIHTQQANAQHYELPPEFFHLCLGARLKYSGCYYPTGGETLEEAENAMLALYAERAELQDGQRILELGCGWGSLTLWMAQHFPNARITAVSNSSSQRQFIQARSRDLGLDNIEVITCDVNVLSLTADTYDRCVSVEMFEHMRNYTALMSRIGDWLKPQGKLFVHVFAHRSLMYPFETDGADNWLGRHFFTGGIMPAADTLLWFQQHLRIEARWIVDGTHYQRTANDWLANQDRHRTQVLQTLASVYGSALAPLWFQRWRIFWMACAELFGYDKGQQWLVAHYRFAKHSLLGQAS
ncbi:cyclopropane-fatty-acyl-phospholipid synthase family protein [Bordetella sp. FB-8]|uniref:SAM-dependent methyltransferase n=1 Tax=Bordetella sp. FB-8 TaxID=1159870 RepID=UPI0004762FD3|nr:cyclopropane-fatty-acyl-phospholipid synthase family protein [Bordetella sp. FB-8]